MRSNLQEAQKIASGSGSEEDVAEAKIEVVKPNWLFTSELTIVRLKYWKRSKRHFVEQI